MSSQRPELVTAYCLSYGHWTLIPHQIEESFRDMVECGFDAVALSFSESELQYARRAFELQVDLAHRCGLKVFAIPSRIGGRFAGAPLMPGLWISQHPEVQAGLGFAGPLGCVESDGFVSWVKAFLTTLLGDYDLDGLIWDEPKDVEAPSHHPATVAKLGEHPTPERMMESFVEFLRELCEHARSLKNDVLQTLFVQKTDPEYFTQRAAHVEALDYHGYDGNLAPQSFFHEPPQWRKYRIDSVWERTLAECRAGGRKTFALVENMLMPTSSIDEYERNLDAYLAGPLPDHLALYYYAHNNEDPERVHAITKRLMRKHL